MSTFKQMLCRALVAAGSRSVPVFDLVAQFEGWAMAAPCSVTAPRP